MGKTEILSYPIIIETSIDEMSKTSEISSYPVTVEIFSIFIVGSHVERHMIHRWKHILICLSGITRRLIFQGKKVFNLNWESHPEPLPFLGYMQTIHHSNSGTYFNMPLYLNLKGSGMNICTESKKFGVGFPVLVKNYLEILMVNLLQACHIFILSVTSN